jgi:hypothetical protein
MSADKLLIVADSERDANMLYAVGLFVPDPFIYLYDGERAHIVLGDLEVRRARRNVGASWDGSAARTTGSPPSSGCSPGRWAPENSWCR